jgi:hypothetical protein
MLNGSSHRCPQACYGCQFTNTLAMMEQHGPECKDLLFQELCELRKRIASQQGPIAQTSSLVFPGTQQPGAAVGCTSNDAVHTNGRMYQDATPLLMTPPSTNVPSSELGANEHHSFDVAVIHEDASTHHRSISILDLDVDIEDSREDARPSALERHSLSDDEMEDGDDSLFEDEADLLVEAISEGEEENARDESGEEDVLREIGVKTELQDRGGCGGIANYATEVVRRSDHSSSDSNIPVSSPFQQGSDTPAILSSSKSFIHAPAATGRLDTISEEASAHTRKSRELVSRSVPCVPTPPHKASNQSSSQTEGPSNSDSSTVHADANVISSTILGYGYMEGGQVFPRTMVPREPFQESSRDEPPPRTSRIKMVRDFGPPPPPRKVDSCGPIRTNMHRRNNAISQGRGLHPYLPNGMHPRQIPPGPPNGSGLVRPAPTFPLPAKPPFMEGQYHPSRLARDPGEYRGYLPNVFVPPPHNWPSRQYGGRGHPIPEPAHLHVYPPQTRRDFEREGFEGELKPYLWFLN